MNQHVLLLVHIYFSNAEELRVIYKSNLFCKSLLQAPFKERATRCVS